MKKKCAYKLPPCPAYDIEGMESWLQDMAAEGLLLEKEEPFFGFLHFAPADPQSAQYRLEPLPKRPRFWDESSGKPSAEALAISEEFGWEFVTRYQEFFIYRSTGPAARELHTDPQVQASTLKVLQKRLLDSIITSLVILVFYSLFGVFRFPLCLTIALGSLTVLLLYLVMLLSPVTAAASLLRLRRLQKALLRGESLNRRKDWRRRAPRHRLAKAAYILASLVMLVSVCRIWLGEHTETPLTEFSGEVPFVTLEDLTPGSQAVTVNKINNGHFQQREDLLFPVVLTWLDGGGIRYPDGRSVGGLLDVNYCEARTPWLARQLAEEFRDYYSWQAKLQKSELEVRELPELGLDYAVGLYNQFGLDRVILAEGSTTVCASLSTGDDDGNFNMEYWAEQMALRLTEGR